MQYVLSFAVLLIAIPTGAQPAAMPKAGMVEIFGVRKVPVEKIRKALGVAAGDPLPKSKGDVEERLEAIDGVVRARLEAYCCELGNAVLYVGIEERGSLGLKLLPYPQDETLTLPAEITSAYADFSSALGRASAESDLKDDLSQGHSLLQNLPARIAQERFVGLAELYIDTLRKVLREAADPELRAVAAYVIGYAPQKAEVIADLQTGLQDPDGSVRLNAARALKAIAYAGMRQPELGFKVQATWFVEMLNSVELSDRLEAVRTLMLFVEKGDEGAIASIRERGLPSLYEMARWQHLPHALPAYLLLGRIHGWKDAALEAAWSAGEREKTLKEIEKTQRRK